MSDSADLRDDLDRIAGMLPLTDREREIAAMIFRGDDFEEIRSEEKWYGPDALRAVRAIDPDFDEKG